MLFTSILFLTLFLPVFLLVYFNRPTNTVALGFSLIFYFWGAPRFLPVVLLVGAGNYFLGLKISVSENTHLRSWLLALGIAVHVGVLVYYKYLMFLIGQINPFVTAFAPGYEFALPAIVLPLGVSFITFEQISYLMDVYRKDCTPARKLTDYYLFLLLFPHSIAGPIFRWKDLEGQIRSRVLQDSQIFDGFVRFIYGLGKKALIANYVAYPVDQVFGLPAEQVGFNVAWLAAISYTLQIYFDFSAYSDMAIGIGKMIGFNFKENFAFPYLSRSVSEFWERWHISLTSWFRTYLYIPLGGNRISPWRTYLNILIVFAVSGFWHGSSWNFLIWGIYYGLLIIIERFLRIGTHAGSQPIINWRVFTTMILVMIGWIFFRARDLGQALIFLKSMAGVHGNPEVLAMPLAKLLPYRCMIAIALAVIALPFEPDIYFALQARLRPVPRWAFAISIFVLSLAAIANSTYNPFIYFRF